MNYFCLQVLEKSCGFACLKMLLANTFKDEEFLNLSEDLKHGEYTFKELINISSNYNLKIEGYEIDLANLSTISVPCIGFIKENKKRHYIYIYYIDSKIIRYFDPVQGEKVIDIDDFNLIKDNKFLLVQHVGKKVELKKENVIDLPFYNVSQYLISLMQCISIFLISFSYKKFNLFLFFSIMLFVASIFIEHYVRVYFLKEFDKKYINPIFEFGNNDEDINMINNLFEIKKDYFLNSNLFLYNAIVFGFSLFILTVNDIKCLICFILLGIVNYIFTNITKSKIELVNIEIEKLEKEKTFESLKSANDMAYDYLENAKFKEILTTLVTIFLSVIICFINGNFQNLIIIFILFKVALEKFDLMMKDDGLYELQRRICLYKSFLNED